MKNSEKHFINWITKTAKKLPSTKLMEVCGTHTVNLFRSGVKSILPPNIEIVSGPGCPVCVTSDYAIDNAVELAEKGVTILTFGDMVRVPGTKKTLEEVGGYKIFYSPSEIFDLLPETGEAVVLSVGFETTVPMLAWVIKETKKRKIKNLSFYSLHKLIPPPLKIIDEQSVIDGFILPGHVSTIIGRKAYDFMKKPGVVTGFEPELILRGLYVLLDLIAHGRNEIINAYSEVVREEGNKEALDMIYSVLEPDDADWRGLGRIKDSGLKLKAEYADFDAVKRYSLPKEGVIEHGPCKCGEVLMGFITPDECPLFAKQCTPDNPVGACMVSVEGSCAAYYRWRTE